MPSEYTELTVVKPDNPVTHTWHCGAELARGAGPDPTFVTKVLHSPLSFLLSSTSHPTICRLHPLTFSPPYPPTHTHTHTHTHMLVDEDSVEEAVHDLGALGDMAVGPQADIHPCIACTHRERGGSESTPV